MGGDWIQTATRYRYTFPVLAELGRDKGCKFVTLIKRLEASDRAIRQALDYLIEIGWVMRNPGYGHPLRPEYILTEGGVAVSGEALRIWNALKKWNEELVALERWPLPVLTAIFLGSQRFGQIRSSVGGITPRALTISLTRLEEGGLVGRTLVDGRPPTTEYSATNWGRELLSPIFG